MQHKVQNRLILQAAIIIFIVGLLVSFFVSLRIEQLLSTSQSKSIHNINTQLAQQTQYVLDNTALFTKMIGTRTRVMEYLKTPTQAREKELFDILDSYQKDNFQYLSIYIMDATGTARISTDRSLVGNNYAFRPYYKEAMNGKPSVYVATGGTTKQLGFYFSHPVEDTSGKAIGVAVVKLSPSSIYKAGTNRDLEEESTVMVTNLEGIILFSTKKDRELKSLGSVPSPYLVKLKQLNTFQGISIIPLWYEDAQQIINNYASPKTIQIMDKQDNERELISIARIHNYPFYFVSEVGMDSIIDQILAIARTLGAIVFAAACVAFLGLYVIVRRHLSPIQPLKEFAEEIRRGHFTHKIEIQTGDEFQELATILGDMGNDLQGKYSDLEKNIQAKTVELNKRLVETEETKKAMLNLLEDVNAQKEKIENHAVELQKFQLAVESAHEHIVITNANGTILYANKAVEYITGFPVNEIIGKKAGCKDLWGGLMSQSVYTSFWKRIKTEKHTFTGEFQNKRKDGEPYTAEAHVSPILNEKGEVQFFVGIERDITKAKQIDRMKTEFISLASHQLRTPLSAMKWFLEMLLNGDAGKLSQEQKEYVTNIDQSNNRMIELVNSLLNVSRIESGRIIIEPVPTDIVKLIQEVKEDILVKLEEKKQQLILDIHKDLPLIPLDKKLIQQVFLNLITNAIKYSPPTTEIYVFVSKDNDNLVVQVSDNGYGIPFSDQKHIFEKFYRAANAVKKETEGNGLGLYLVKSIVESSGGKLWFTSEEKKGSSFYFSIPLKGMPHKAGEVRIS